MLCIRIFKTRKEAQWAKNVLKEGGIMSFIDEDKFNNVPIQEFGVRARLRLHVLEEDFLKAANSLAKKIRESRLK
ncbi:MAG: hypothetical protein HY344_03680 [Candidatus Levybacteria bacterium]|nr:hypothetical protein [Candidatus Levybacteria bacterium]